MRSKKQLAGVSLAALAACGLTMLSTAALAGTSTASINWYAVYNAAHPEGSVASGSVALTQAPLYAEQAINYAIANSTAITIPGYGSGSPYGGFTYVDQAYAGVAGTTAVQFIFTLPTGDYLASCPTTTGGVDGSNFTGVASLTCSGSPNLNTITVDINLNQAGGGLAWYQLPPLKIAGSSPGLATLAAETSNGGTLASFGMNCSSLSTACDIQMSYAEATNFGSGSQIMAMSGNELSLSTFNQSNLICIDVLSDQQPGTEFQQPCGGKIGYQAWDSPTNLDGTQNGAPVYTHVNDPACTNTASEPQCGNGNVTGTVSNSDTLVADKGTIAIDETLLLGADGVHYYVWGNGTISSNYAIITVTGVCAGLEAPVENVGSVPASCGMRPFTGESYVGLTPVAYTAPSDYTNLMNGTLGVCPKEDDLEASVANGGITNTSNGAQAVWGLDSATFNTIVLPDVSSGTTVTVLGPNFDPTKVIYYELCDYASGTTILGPVANWYTSVSVDCVGSHAGLPDCTILADGNDAVHAPKGQPADALLTYAFNGKGQLFQFVDARSDYQAYIRVVNLMQDFANSNGACTVTDTATENPCEPQGAVVCKIWGDDGQNAYVTLWPTAVNGTTVQGETTGTNSDFSVASLFAQAGITNFSNNQYEFGSLLCFHNDNIHLTQWWLEPNGTVVNIQ